MSTEEPRALDTRQMLARIDRQRAEFDEWMESNHTIRQMQQELTRLQLERELRWERSPGLRALRVLGLVLGMVVIAALIGATAFGVATLLLEGRHKQVAVTTVPAPQPGARQ